MYTSLSILMFKAMLPQRPCPLPPLLRTFTFIFRNFIFDHCLQNNVVVFKGPIHAYN